MTPWQDKLILQTQSEIDSAMTLDTLEAIGLQLITTTQRWFHDACWPILKKRQAELGAPEKSPIALVVDTMQWIRADFSVNGDVEQTVQAFMRRLMLFAKKTNAQWVIAAADSSQGTELRRKALCPSYKSSRDERPSTINEVADKVKASCAHYQVPWISCEAWEADDVAATIVTRGMGRGVKSVICTTDRDYMQLVCGDVVLFSGGKYTNVARVVEGTGVMPSDMVEYLTLCGKDDLPHPSGFGTKSAMDCIHTYGNFMGLYDARHSFTEARRAALEQFAPLYWNVRECHTLNRDVKLTFDWTKTHCLPL